MDHHHESNNQFWKWKVCFFFSISYVSVFNITIIII
jgi:hypothetical protein